jgi:hypothetical protein
VTKVLKLRDDEKLAISAVSKEFFCAWRPGENPPDAYLILPSHEVAVEITTLTQRITDDGGTRSRITDDAPGIRLIAELNDKLQHLVPDDVQIGFTMRTPILKLRKTKSALVKILGEQLPDIVMSDSIHEICLFGNTIQLIRYPRVPSDRPKIWGIATHGSASRNIDMNAWNALEERIVEKSRKCDGIGGRMPVWLVLLNEYWLADAGSYRQALATISKSHPFEKILLINPDASVSTLFEGM